MDLLRIVSPIYSENTYVLGTETGQALVVDPGAGNFPRVKQVLESLQMQLGAILLTHGHADHIWDAHQVQQINPEAPILISAPDMFWFDAPGPAEQLGNAGYMAANAGPWQAVAPTELDPAFFAEGGAQLWPGLAVRAFLAPGHSPGCTMFFLSGKVRDHGQGLGFPPDEDALFGFSGDVVFRGSVGRTDLPHSDPKAMEETLRTLRQVIAPQTLLLPGHGQATSWGEELRSNPFLLN